VRSFRERGGKWKKRTGEKAHAAATCVDLMQVGLRVLFDLRRGHVITVSVACRQAYMCVVFASLSTSTLRGIKVQFCNRN